MKIVKAAAAVTLVVLIGFIFLQGQENEVEVIEKRYTFICSLQWDSLQWGIRAADAEFGTNTKCYATSTPDVEKQAEEIRNAVLAGVDGIITSGAENSPELAAAIAEAVEQGIPVVLVDSDLPDSGRLCYIGIDNYAAGWMAGSDMAEATGGVASIAAIVVSQDSVNQRERLAGFQDAIAEYPDMEVEEILECNSEPLKIHKSVVELLRTNDSISAVFCAEGTASRMLGGILSEQEDYLSRQLRIVGFDAMRYLEEYVSTGQYYSCIVQPYYQEGYLAVKALVEYDNGAGEIPADVYLDPLDVKTQEDIEQINQEEGELLWYYY
ncbi:MAG: substrate-binding domain-containing protein [Lachnospiraceae bacterium]|nr:substrate-binding domain-containing protein [Lachnospiraceae bacterium]